MDTSRNVLKARCDSTGLMIRFIFWAYAIYLVAMTAVGLVLVFRPEGDFSLSLASGRDGMGGYGFFYGGLMGQFSWNSLTEQAVNAPKLVYLIGYFCGIAVKICYLGILWQVARIFKGIDENSSPFVHAGCRRISRIGILVIASGLIQYGLQATILGILDLGGGGGNTAWFGILLAGIVIIALSYIFEYGTALQIESDETL